MPTATITVDATLKARLTELANQTGQRVDDFVEALLRRVTEADIRFDHGVPVFRSRPGAPVLTVEDVDRLAHGDEAQLPAWSACTPGGKWPPEATADRLLLLTVSNPEFMWWPDMVSPAVLPEVRAAATAKQVTDRYLIGLARRNGGRVVTFDRALATAGGDDVVCLLPNNRKALSALSLVIEKHPQWADPQLLRATLLIVVGTKDYAAVLADIDRARSLQGSSARKGIYGSSEMSALRAKVNLLAANPAATMSDLEAVLTSQPDKAPDVFNTGGVILQ